jgi:branched-chain amino acid transport system permease protein
VLLVGAGDGLIVLFINFRLRDSRLGRAWIAVREDEVAAARWASPRAREAVAYAIGARIGGFAARSSASYRNTVNVDQFEFGFSVFVLCMVILGGMGTSGA